MPGGANPYLSLKQQKERTNYDMEDLPRLRERLEQLRMEINGEDYSFITKYDENEIKILHADCLENAVNTARENANIGDVVTLSTASASFDLYKDFEERGRHFKSIVNNLE